MKSDIKTEGTDAIPSSDLLDGEPVTPNPICQCPECGSMIPCERVHNGICYIYHAVHCGWGFEATPIQQLDESDEGKSWPHGWRTPQSSDDETLILFESLRIARGNLLTRNAHESSGEWLFRTMALARENIAKEKASSEPSNDRVKQHP